MPPRRWDVVVYAQPHRNGVKSCSRIIGLPEEVLDFGPDGLTINGKKIRSPNVTKIDYEGPKRLSVLEEKVYGTLNISFPYKVPKTSYFVIGDNVLHSMDSRHFGAIKQSEIFSKVILGR